MTQPADKGFIHFIDFVIHFSLIKSSHLKKYLRKASSFLQFPPQNNESIYFKNHQNLYLRTNQEVVWCESVLHRK
jgi:hypothetical protein